MWATETNRLDKIMLCVLVSIWRLKNRISQHVFFDVKTKCAASVTALFTTSLEQNESKRSDSSMTLREGHSHIIIKPRFTSPGGVLSPPVLTLKARHSRRAQDVSSLVVIQRGFVGESEWKVCTGYSFDSGLLVFCRAGLWARTKCNVIIVPDKDQLTTQWGTALPVVRENVPFAHIGTGFMWLQLHIPGNSSTIQDVSL